MCAADGRTGRPRDSLRDGEVPRRIRGVERPQHVSQRHHGSFVDRQRGHPPGRLERHPDLARALQHADAEHLVDDDARLDAVSLRLHGPGARGRDPRDQTDHSEGVGEEPAEAWEHGSSGLLPSM
jgi:hypothetical protein